VFSRPEIELTVVHALHATGENFLLPVYVRAKGLFESNLSQREYVTVSELYPQ
jgi:hypothetical protein